MAHMAASTFKNQANFNFDSEEFPYEVPERRIFDVAHVAEFQQSPTCVDLTMFMIEIMKAIKTSKMNETECPAKI